jgi:hypothetical protein
MPKKVSQHKNRSRRFITGVRPRRGNMSAVNELLDRQPALRSLAAERARQADWLQWVRQVLAPELASHVSLAVAKNDELILYVASAAWSNRLRYAVGALHNLLQARDASLSKIRVRVMPP